MYTYDDTNVCFMHACLLGGRCLDRRCRMLLKHPGTLCGGCVYQRAIAARGEKKIITFMHLFPMFQLLYCLAHLHSFIYLLMWHFCYTEHVSFIYTFRTIMLVFFKQSFHYIIFILFYMIIIISVAVALAAMFSLSNSLLTIIFS